MFRVRRQGNVLEYAPPHRTIEMKIGEELRERLELPRELPHNLLALLMQITGDGDIE